MLIRSYVEIHSPIHNAQLLHACQQIGNRNHWIGSDTPPHNMVEEYLQQWYRAFLTGDYVGIEYWVYKAVKGSPMSFHFDKDEMDPQIEHPKWCGLVNLTYDKSATCISDMKYGDIKPTECIYSYGAEGKTMIWDGNVAWSDMASHDDCKLYVNVWTDRRPKGLTRSKEMPYYPYTMIKGIYDKCPIIPFEGDDYVTHTHMCGNVM